MALGSAALKLFQTILYGIEFCCAAIILGIYGYFLSVLADRDLFIATWIKAVTGLSGAALLYTIFAVLLTCLLGGKTVFALLAILFDILFCGAMIAIAVLTRDGAHSCSGNVDTPIGNGSSSSRQGFSSSGQEGRRITFAVSLGGACRMNKACFAVAIVGAILFPICALVQLALSRKHKHDKRYGPSPANGYTGGRGNKFFGRKRHNQGVYVMLKWPEGRARLQRALLLLGLMDIAHHTTLLTQDPQSHLLMQPMSTISLCKEATIQLQPGLTTLPRPPITRSDDGAYAKAHACRIPRDIEKADRIPHHHGDLICIATLMSRVS